MGMGRLEDASHGVLVRRAAPAGSPSCLGHPTRCRRCRDHSGWTIFSVRPFTQEGCHRDDGGGGDELHHRAGVVVRDVLHERTTPGRRRHTTSDHRGSIAPSPDCLPNVHTCRPSDATVRRSRRRCPHWQSTTTAATHTRCLSECHPHTSTVVDSVSRTRRAFFEIADPNWLVLNATRRTSSSMSSPRNTAAHHSVQQGNVGDGDLWWLCDAYMLMHKHINDPSTVEMLTYILVQCSFICVLLINVASMLFFP